MKCTLYSSHPCSTYVLLFFNQNASGFYLRIGAVVWTNDSGTQFFSHLPGQQTVNRSFSRAPCTSIDENHQWRRHFYRPAHIRRVVQVQFVASTAKCDALLSVQTDNTVNLDTIFGTVQTFFSQWVVKETERNKTVWLFHFGCWAKCLYPNYPIFFLNTPFHNDYGFCHSCTMTSTDSKVSHIADIWEFPAQLWSNSIFAWWRGQT